MAAVTAGSAYTGTSFDEVVEGSIHNSTLHVATASGSSMSFSFNGTSVAVFGSVWPPAATYVPLTTSEYTPTQAEPAYQRVYRFILAPNLTIPKNNLNFYSSGNIPYDAYVLTINVTQTSIDSPYYLDYIAFEVPGPVPSTTSMQTARSDETTGATSASSAAPGPVLPVGAIIGVAIGSVCALALALALVIFACLRRRPPPSEFNYGSVGQRDLPSPVIPYVTSGTQSQMGCDTSISALGLGANRPTSPFDASNIAGDSMNRLIGRPSSASDGHAVDEEPPPAYTPS